MTILREIQRKRPTERSTGLSLKGNSSHSERGRVGGPIMCGAPTLHQAKGQRKDKGARQSTDHKWYPDGLTDQGTSDEYIPTEY